MAVLLLAIECPTVVGLYPFVDRGAREYLFGFLLHSLRTKAMAARDLSDFRRYTNEES
jgi:hypothetical protein